MGRKRIVVIGAGGMARELAWLIRAINQRGEEYEFLGYVVTDTSRLRETDSVREVLGDYDWLTKHSSEIDAITIGVGSPDARLNIAVEVSALLPHVEWPALVHPSVVLDQETCRIGEGVSLCAGVVATINIEFEPFALCNFGCTVGHESRIGSGAVINPGANISGGVSIGRGVLVGTGAQVLQYLSVGDGATVGAGAVVTHDVAAGDTVAGVPARKMMSSRSAIVRK
jgi:sugar O-acyltransferase (sialic acid O-acetyltransferase NeuD family)